MPIMGWVCRLCAVAMHRGDAFARSEGGINTFGLTLRCKRIKRRQFAFQTLSLELTKLSGRRQPDDIIRLNRIIVSSYHRR